MNEFKKMKQGIALKCPNCGSQLKFDPATQMFLCDNCNSRFSETEIHKKTTKFEEKETFDDSVKEYHCPGCGAELLADETTATDFCPYCGSSVVFHGRVSGAIKPRYIIPFKINKETAKSTLREYLRNHLFVPRGFLKGATLDKISGIYYPFWEADIKASASLSAEATKTKTWTSGDKRYTETKHYKVNRAGNIDFEDITENALKSADKKLVESILPFPIKEHIPFEMTYLSGFHAKKNDLSYKDVSENIKRKMKEYSETILEDTIFGYDSVRIKSSSCVARHESHDYVLLPVWILSYKHKKIDYIFAINGSTGKVFGEVPCSKPKIGFAAVGIGLGILGLIALIGGLI